MATAATIKKQPQLFSELDAERTQSPIFVFNSSIIRFTRAFQLLDQQLSRGRIITIDLASQVRQLDVDVFPQSEWRDLIQYVGDG